MKPSPIDQLSRFSEALRHRGLTVTADQTADMARALDLVDLSQQSQAKASLRSLTVTSPAQIPVFDEEFERFFGQYAEPTLVSRNPDKSESMSGASLSLHGVAGTTTVAVTEQSGASAVDRLVARDFAGLDDDDLAEARRLISSMIWAPTNHRTRRWKPSDRGRRPDMRRTLRSAVGPTGEMMTLEWKKRRQRQRPLIVIADISGSMEKYADMFLVFAHAAQRKLGDVDVFTFSTRLSRVTEDLRRRDTRAALDRVAKTVSDWSGGTQIGEAIATWNRNWSRRLARGGPIALILSDGWDCGDPELLAEEMGRLSRSVHQVIWLNPLASRRDYQPLTRGMQAVLPHIDHLLPAASVKDFAGVVRLLDSIAATR